MIFAFKLGFLEITWVDFIDVGLVSILLYQIYKLIRGSIAVNIFLGLLALYLVYLMVRAAQMELLVTILGQFMGVGFIAMIVLFQPEIRKFLLVLGRSTEFRENFVKTLATLRHGYVEDFDIRQVTENPAGNPDRSIDRIYPRFRIEILCPDRGCPGCRGQQKAVVVNLQQDQPSPRWRCDYL
jgi:hypothetical protein